MAVIDAYSRATVQFTLTWNSTATQHIERLWANPVSFWRDILDPGLVSKLKGKDAGDHASVTIPANRFPFPYEEHKKIVIRADQFQGFDGNGDPLVPSMGRFYPQGMLHGVGNVFTVSTAPCRYLGQQGDRLIFDLNHPLAGHDLQLQAAIITLHPGQKERGGRCEDWLERIAADGPGMQARLPGADSWLTVNDHFLRRDNRPDELFYQQPRLVHHLDSTARREIGGQYARLIQPGGRVLDLMGSWTSHLPDSLDLAELTVLGMNAEELQQNSRASRTQVQDLNVQPQLPFADGAFDAVICTASVEYLIDPLAVMAEIRRVLRPGGLMAFAFSNRWFPPKVIRIWPDLHEFERLGLVADLLHASGSFAGVTTLSQRGQPRPKDDPYQEFWFSDPVYMVWGNKA